MQTGFQSKTLKTN